MTHSCAVHRLTACEKSVLDHGMAGFRIRAPTGAVRCLAKGWAGGHSSAAPPATELKPRHVIGHDQKAGQLSRISTPMTRRLGYLFTLAVPLVAAGLVATGVLGRTPPPREERQN